MPVQGAAFTLSQCALFKDFSETGLAIVASIAVDRSLASGTPLFVEGMDADAFFIVKSGSVRVALKNETEEQTIGVLGEGEALGQLSLLGAPGARLVTAIAEGPTELIEIRQRDFLRLQTQKPQACLKLMMAVAAQIGQLLADNRELLKTAALGRLKQSS